jgi:multisubunit Na+/H+ antiporter MnhB subunit
MGDDGGRMAPQKIKRISVVLLALGFGAALAIYLTAQPVVVDPLLGDPMASKKYLHELRVIGGQGNVVASEFLDWFAGLWHGRSLAGTVAVITVITVLIFRFVASHPGTPAEEQTGGEDRRKM